MSKKWEKWNDSFSKRVDWGRVATEVLELDLGFGTPSNGWVSCRHWDGSDANASCSFNVDSGYFKDFRNGGKAISAYDAMVLKGVAKHFGDARSQLAGMFGLQLPETEKGDPEYGVKWKAWDDRLAEQYCGAKPPITVEGLKKAGARLCMRHGVLCFALPVVDYNATIVGWMFLRQNGEPFEQKDGNKPKAICKVRDKDHGAFVCDPAAFKELSQEKEGLQIDDTMAKATPIYWCEGAPDMLAALSSDSGYNWFITNCHGTNENIQWQAPWRYSVTLIADCDIPGIAGAYKRARSIDKVVSPPGEIAKDHGSDLRDFIQACPKEWQKMLVDRTDDKKQATDEERKQRAKNDADRERKEISKSHEFLAECGCHIIDVDQGKSITLYSDVTHATKVINSGFKFVSYEDMVQLFGWSFRSRVLQTMKEVQTRASVGDTGYRCFSDFKLAVALASTDTEYKDLESIGLGIWAVEDMDRDRTGETLIVKYGASYVYNNGHMKKVKKPIVGRFIANMSDKVNWFNEGLLCEYVQQAQNEQWRVDAYDELYAIVRQWNWAHKDMPQVCIGLIMATWIQTTLKWRPIVAMTGESNSGKTVLMEVMDKMFLGLAQFSAQSTAAGVLQNMGLNSKPMLIDEFDSGQEQTKLFKHFRVSSRGQDMLKGTAHQDGKTYKVRHIPWIAGIHASSRHQADLNRMIQLSIKQAKGNRYSLELPDTRTLRDLGHRILAGMIVTAEAAYRLSQTLTKMNSDGSAIQSRYRESYSIPYGCLGAFLGVDETVINGIMEDYLSLEVAKSVVLDDAGTDQEALLNDILGSEVRMPKDSPMETASIAEILFDPELTAFRNVARTKGVGYVVSRTGNHKKVCFFGRKLTGKHGVLRSTDWESVAGLHQILERLPGELEPSKEKQMNAGTTSTCISVNWSSLRKWREQQGHNKEDVES